MISSKSTWMVLLFVTWLIEPVPLVAQDDSAATDDAAASPFEEGGGESVLVKEPTTPSEYMEAVLFTMKIARPEAARKYLDALLALEPDDDTLISFRSAYGTATILQLSRFDELNPSAAILLERMNAASSRRASDPAYLDSLLQKLSGTPREADMAIRDLQHLGAPAAARLVQAAADPNSGIDRDQAFIALTRMGQSAVAPLVGFIDHGDDDQKMLAIETFGWVASKADLPYLYSEAFSTTGQPAVREAARRAMSQLIYKSPEHSGRLDGFGAATELRLTAEKLITKETTLEAEEDGLLPIWGLDESTGGLSEKRVSPESASIFRAEQFARRALLLSPQDSRIQSVLLNVILTRDVEAAGWDQPVPTGAGTANEIAVLAGSSACLDALAVSGELNSFAAAESLIKALAQNGTASLVRTGGSRGAVVAALDHPSTRVQFAAAETILQWDPTQPFAGSQRVVEVLARALDADAQANGIVIDPNNTRGSQLAQFLKDMGYEAQITPTGADGFTIATTHGDVDLAVLHLNTIRWDLSSTIANFRADSRTKNLPIAIYGPRGLRAGVDYLLVNDSRITYVEESVRSIDFTRQLRPFLAQVEPPKLTAEQQTTQAKVAARWLRRIAESRTNVYDFTQVESTLAQAATRIELAGDVSVALAAVPSASAQSHLAEAAINPSYPTTMRGRAAQLTASHIRRHQSLLSEELKKRLVEAWSSETDPVVRAALAAVVGVQGPHAEGIPNLLLQSTPATTPNP